MQNWFRDESGGRERKMKYRQGKVLSIKPKDQYKRVDRYIQKKFWRRKCRGVEKDTKYVLL